MKLYEANHITQEERDVICDWLRARELDPNLTRAVTFRDDNTAVIEAYRVHPDGRRVLNKDNPRFPFVETHTFSLPGERDPLA